MIPGEFARLEFDVVQRCADVVHKLLLLFGLRIFVGDEIDADVAWRNDGVERVSALVHGDGAVMEQIRDVGGRRHGEARLLHGKLDGEVAVGVFRRIRNDDDRLAVRKASVCGKSFQSIHFGFADVRLSMVDGKVFENVAELAADGESLLDVLHEEGVGGLVGEIVVRLLMVDDHLAGGEAEFVALEPDGNERRENGGVIDLQAVAADIPLLVVVVGDAVRIEAERAAFRFVILQVGWSEAFAVFAGVDDVQQTVREEIDGILVELAAMHFAVVQNAVLLHVEGVLPVVAVLRDGDDVLPFLREAFADFREVLVACVIGLAVAAETVDVGGENEIDGVLDEPFDEFRILPVEGFVAPCLAAEPVRMVFDELAVRHGAPCDDVQQDVDVPLMGLVHETAERLAGGLLVRRFRVGGFEPMDALVAVAVAAGAFFIDGAEPQGVDAERRVVVEQRQRLVEGPSK